MLYVLFFVPIFKIFKKGDDGVGLCNKKSQKLIHKTKSKRNGNNLL